MKKKWTGLATAAMVFAVGVCIWTFSHNVDLYGRGLSTKSRTIGIVGSLFAEIFVLWALSQYLRYSGDRGRAGRRASLVMLAVLLLNTVIAHLKASNQAQNFGYLFDLYASYGVPIAFAVAIVWGVDHVIQHDPDSRESAALADEAQLERHAQIQATEALASQTEVVLQGTEAKQLIQQAAQQRAMAIVARVTGQPQARQLSSGTQPLAIEAVSVEEIDEHSNQPQYVNGAAKTDPKGQPRRFS